ncbi:MAG TPA: cobalamin-binding protein [Thermoplasmata archaeon]|nr:cobalamin-binding protein [Thermoplasmata archaeon]
MRVVSVLPSATELVCALGHAASLVGRSAECDFPPEVSRLPIVMRPRALDSDRPSAEIDARVRRARAQDESLYTLDVELLRSLRPDLLLTQDLCGVCSVTSAEVAHACSQAGISPKILSLMPRTLEEVWATIPCVAAAMGDLNAGTRLLASIRDRIPHPTASSADRPRVAVVEWVDPPILGGLWDSDVVREGGGEPIGPRSGEPAKRVSWDSLHQMSPDLLVISPCSFTVTRSLQELADPRVRAEVSRISPALGTFVADEAYFSRPGPRLVEGIRLIHRLIRQAWESWPMPVARWPETASRLVSA